MTLKQEFIFYGEVENVLIASNNVDSTIDIQMILPLGVEVDRDEFREWHDKLKSNGIFMTVGEYEADIDNT